MKRCPLSIQEGTLRSTEAELSPTIVRCGGSRQDWIADAQHTGVCQLRLERWRKSLRARAAV